MLKKTNILALVGGGESPKFSKDKITIYDSHQGLILSQIRFNSKITNVKIRTDSIIGFIEDKIYILNINTLETIDIIEIDQISYPIYGLSNSNNGLVLAFPQYNNKGKIQIGKYYITKKNFKKETFEFTAHESNIIFIAMNDDGTLIVTGSEKGQFLRLFNASNGDLIPELKKGKKSKVSWIAFEFSSEIVAYVTDIGKVYIYNITEIKKVININNDKNNNKIENNKKKENINKIHEKNKIKIKPFLKCNINKERNIIGFAQPKSIVILNWDGILYKASYDVKSEKKCFIYKTEYIKIDDN